VADAAKSKAQRYNQILMESATKEDDEPLDDEVSRQYSQLCSVIQRISQTYYVEETVEKHVLSNEEGLLVLQQELFREWTRQPPEHRKLRLRACIFSHLHKRILSQPRFNLPAPVDRDLAEFEEFVHTIPTGMLY
jgi:hypothetical protein